MKEFFCVRSVKDPLRKGVPFDQSFLRELVYPDYATARRMADVLCQSSGRTRMALVHITYNGQALDASAVELHRHQPAGNGEYYDLVAIDGSVLQQVNENSRWTIEVVNTDPLPGLTAELIERLKTPGHPQGMHLSAMQRRWMTRLQNPQSITMAEERDWFQALG